MFVWQASLHTLTTMNRKPAIAANNKNPAQKYGTNRASQINSFLVLLQHDKTFCMAAVTLESASPKGNEATTSPRVSLKCSQRN